MESLLLLQATQMKPRHRQIKSMQLLSGNDLVTLFNNLPEEQLKTYLGNALKGEYSTPTCPSCNQKWSLELHQKESLLVMLFGGVEILQDVSGLLR